MAASWVYILQCRDGSYYTGCTTKLEQRIGQHKAGTYSGYTAARLPVECVWVAEFQTIYDAIDFERRLKRWSRAKKEAVIRGEWDPCLNSRAAISIMGGERVRPSTRTLRVLLRMTNRVGAVAIASLTNPCYTPPLRVRAKPKSVGGAARTTAT